MVGCIKGRVYFGLGLLIVGCNRVGFRRAGCIRVGCIRVGCIKGRVYMTHLTVAMKLEFYNRNFQSFA